MEGANLSEADERHRTVLSQVQAELGRELGSIDTELVAFRADREHTFR